MTCITASSGHSRSAWWITRGSLENACGTAEVSASRIRHRPTPPSTDSSIMRRAAARASWASPAPSRRPTITCPAMAIASSTSARKPKICIPIWWAPSDQCVHASEDGAGDEERQVERGGAQDQGAAHPHQRAHHVRVRAAPGGADGRPQQAGGEGDAHPRLGDHRPPCRADQAPVEDVDEHELQDDVDEVGDHHDHQRPAQVADPALIALAGEGDERPGQPDRTDAQERRRHLADVAVPTEQPHDRAREHRRERGDEDADADSQPQRLRGHRRRPLLLARAVQPGDLGGHPVGEEVAERRQRREDRAGQRESRQLGRAEVADDARVGQQVQGLCRQRAECRERENEDLAVVGGTAAHGRPTIRSGVR